MKIALICFSLIGNDTMNRLADALRREGHEVFPSCKSRYLKNSIAISAREWAGERFSDSEGVIFIGAAGIAVRSIAPFIVSKKQDPAVLVIDEGGTFVISLLSGHLGGANDFALLCAGLLNAQPIITTATDLEHRFAVDVFAKKNHCGIQNMSAAKEVSAALLAGKPVGFYTDLPYEGELPSGVVLCDSNGVPAQNPVSFDCPEAGFAVTISTQCRPFQETTQLFPRILTLGIGCRKQKDPKELQEMVLQWLSDHHISREAIARIASIDLKKEEPGILALSDLLGVPFLTYSAEELRRVEGEFTPSGFVSSITGVDNVCERSAVLASGNGRLIFRKFAQNGVTIAAAIKNEPIQF